MMMVFAKCPKCDEESFLICPNCDKHAQFGEIAEIESNQIGNNKLANQVATRCDCGQAVSFLSCGCGTTIYGKFFFTDKTKEADYERDIKEGKIDMNPNRVSTLKYIFHSMIAFIVFLSFSMTIYFMMAKIMSAEAFIVMLVICLPASFWAVRLLHKVS